VGNMEIKQIEKRVSVAIDEPSNKFNSTISIINDMLEKEHIKIKFELSQQNRYNYGEKGEGTLIVLVIE